MVFKSGVYCKGLVCDNWNRKSHAKCQGCGVAMCSLCSIKAENKKVYCPNCYITCKDVNLENINKEIDDFLTTGKAAQKDKQGVMA